MVVVDTDEDSGSTVDLEATEAVPDGDFVRLLNGFSGQTLKNAFHEFFKYL